MEHKLATDRCHINLLLHLPLSPQCTQKAINTIMQIAKTMVIPVATSISYIMNMNLDLWKLL